MHLIGLDVGTSSTKALVVDDRGNPVGRASGEYPVSTPRPNWAEQDPDWWWNAARTAIAGALKCSGVDPVDIAAVGLSGQMHGTVLVDRTLRSVRPAIIWMDGRSAAQCEEIRGRVGVERLAELTCNPVMPGFMAASLLWILENEPRSLRRARRALLPKDYVRLRLTGDAATDVSDASSTLLFDVRRRRWSEALISTLGLSRDLFPEAYESPAVTGEVSGEAAAETGLRRGTPVVAGAGDSEAGAVGCGVTGPGVVSSNIGTGGQLFAALDRVEVDRRLRVHTFCHAVPGRWHLQGAVLSAGLSLRWFAENLGHLERLVGCLSGADPYDLLSQEAARAEPGCGGLVFLPYLSGERSPHMDPDARGVFFGLRLGHTRAHLVRAVMEGVVYALRDCLEVFRELGVRVDRVVARGGGAKSRVWLQIQADMYNAEVATVEAQEDAALGAAVLAAVGAGVYRGVEEACGEMVRFTEGVAPDPERARIYDRYYREVYRHLYPSLRPFFTKHGN